MQQKIVHAGVNSVSYQQAARDLAELSNLSVAPKPVERMVRRIGRERIDRREQAVKAHKRLPLMAKDAVANSKHSCPKVAMVSMDGCRLQIRPEPSEPKQDSHWRESKVAVLETYQSEVHQADPDPDVPRCFLDLKRTKEMVRGLGHAFPVGVKFGVEKQTSKQNKTGQKRGKRLSRPVRSSVWSAAYWLAARSKPRKRHGLCRSSSANGVGTSISPAISFRKPSGTSTPVVTRSGSSTRPDS